MAKRAFLIVLDSVGIGKMPDAAEWGDEGSDTLASIRNHPDFDCPNLTEMGLCDDAAVKISLGAEEPSGE